MLATNTSSLSITEMAGDLAHPERVVGFHFFNPVAVMPLLEIVRGERTDDATLATAFATGKTLKKTTILVRDSPSFIVNRLLGRFMSEVGRIVDEGTPVTVADGAFAGVAPMPPFLLLSLVGPAIALHNTETLHGAFPDRFNVSPRSSGWWQQASPPTTARTAASTRRSRRCRSARSTRSRSTPGRSAPAC